MKKTIIYFLLLLTSNSLLAQSSLSELKKRYYSVDETLKDGFRRIYTKEYKLGYVDAMGKEVIATQYTSGTPFHMGLALVSIKKENDYNSYSGIINQKNEIILPFEYQITGNFEYTNDHIIIQRANKYGIFSLKEKKIILPVEYQSLSFSSFTSNKTAYIVAKNNLMGVMDEELKFIIPLQYDNLTLLSGYYNGKIYSLIATKQAKGTGLIDMSGKVIIPLKYSSLEIAGVVKGNIPLFRVVVGGKVGIIDEKDNLIIPCNFESLKLQNIQNEEWIYFAKKNGKMGIIDSKGEWIIQPQYDNMASQSYRSEGNFSASKNGKWGLISATNNVLVDFKYDSPIEDFGYNDFTQVKQDGKTGLIDKNGKESLLNTIGCKDLLATMV